MADSTPQEDTQEFPVPQPQDSVHEPRVDLINEIKKGDEPVGQSKIQGVEIPTPSDQH